jgi:outer membrane protein assembly factor BamB
MKLLALALALAAQPGNATQLRPAPARMWDVAWQRKLVPPTMLEYHPREVGGPAIDPTTGTVVVGTRDGFVRAYTESGEPLWEFKTGGRFDGTPRVDGATVYVGSSDGRLYALDVASGALRWKYEAGEEVGTTPAVAGGLALVMTLQDTLVAVDAKTGAWKWHHRRETQQGFTIRGAASVTVAGDVVLGAYSDGTVAALDLATGTMRWERRVSAKADFMDVDSTPRVERGRVYLAAYAGTVQAVELASGNAIWETKTAAPLRLALGRGVLVAVTTTQIVGLSPQDGKVRWTLPLDGAPGGEPTVLGNRALVPNGKALLWVDADRGRLLRAFDPGTGVSAAVATRGGRVYVLSNGGDLFALDAV